MFGKTHVVVSTERVANALLTDRGAIYSSREQSPFAAQLLTRGNLILLRPYGGRQRHLLNCFAFKKNLGSFWLIQHRGLAQHAAVYASSCTYQ